MPERHPAQQALRRAVPVQRATAAPTLEGLRRASPDVYPAGRLDADSEGLVVLTADGALQARIADPRHKLCEDLLGAGRRRAVARRDSRRCARGVDARRLRDAAGARARAIDAAALRCGRAIRPIRVRKRDPDRVARARDSREGRNRQVRRMTAAVGLADAAARSARRSGRGRSARPRAGPMARGPRVAHGACVSSAPADRCAVDVLSSAAAACRPSPGPLREASPLPVPDDPPPARPLLCPAGGPASRASTRATQHPVRRDQVSHGARTVTRKLQDAGFKAFIVGGAVRDLLLGIDAEGLRHRDRRDARAGQAAVPARVHHRPPLPPRARARRQRGDRGVDVPRARRPATTRPTSTAGSSPTTSTARRPRTPRGATSRSTRCTSIRRPRRCGTTSAASPTCARGA